jgi:hypothetical protein
MSETSGSKSVRRTSRPENSGRWDRFWFSPTSVQQIGLLRGVLCVITAIYFVSCWGDAAFWYADQGPLSSERVATFLQTSGLDDAARWIVSPLFLSNSPIVYRIYLAVGIAMTVVVASGRGGRWPGWVLWLLLVGWANREMLLSSLTESALSLGLFASAIAPPAPLMPRRNRDDQRHWMAGFAARLMAVQATVIAGATWVTMLGGRVWFNGLGAYALAAPAQDRTIDWTQFAWFRNPIVYESLTHLLVLVLPIGLTLAWRPSSSRIGKAMLLAWCLVIATLSSHWLYTATLATMLMAVGRVEK